MIVAIVVAALSVSAVPARAQAAGAATPLPPIGLTLPPIGLPLPRIGLDPPPSPGLIDGGSRRDDRRGRGGEHRGRRGRHGHTLVILGLPAFAGHHDFAGQHDHEVEFDRHTGELPSDRAADLPPPPVAERGTLRLLIDVDDDTRDQVQVFVDGVFVGMLADLGSDLALEMGTRRIELRAPGHEPLVFDVRIAAGAVIVYRGTLEPRSHEVARPSAAPPSAGAQQPAPASGSSTFYLIPGCYLGNVPPERVTLPPGCEGRPVVTQVK